MLFLKVHLSLLTSKKNNLCVALWLWEKAMAKHRYIRDYSTEPHYHIGIPTLKKWQIHSGLTNFKNGKIKLIANNPIRSVCIIYCFRQVF